MNQKGVVQIAGLPIILMIIIGLIITGVMFFFFKSLVLAIILAGIGGFILWKVSDDLKNKDAQFIGAISLILILSGLFVGVTQPLSVVGESVGTQVISLNESFITDNFSSILGLIGLVFAGFIVFGKKKVRGK